MVECTLLDQWCRTSSEEALVSQNYLRVSADQENSHRHIRPPYRHQFHTRLQHLMLYSCSIREVALHPALLIADNGCASVKFPDHNNAKLVLGVVPRRAIPTPDQGQETFAQLDQWAGPRVTPIPRVIASIDHQ